MKCAGKVLKIISLTIVVVVFTLIIACSGLFIYARKNIDTDADEMLFKLAKQGNITEFYANGAPLGSDYYIPVKIDSAAHVEAKKRWCSINEVSSYLKDGFVAVEDREFYTHNGVNYRRTFAALLNSVFKFDNRFGASTITQQTVKNISGDNEPTFKRKLNEILRALSMESKHSKDEILELYLNIVPMGENSIGVCLASEIYFDKMPSELEADEAALLIGIANAPTRYNPYINPDAAKDKRNAVLKTMYEHGILSYDEYFLNVNKQLRLNDRKNHRNPVNSWFIETVCADIIDDLHKKYDISKETAKKILVEGGVTVYTTESVYIQDVLEKHLENIGNSIKEIENGLEYAAVIIDSVNGNLLGIIGQAGKKEGEWLINHATAPHTPASTLKPLALYAPLIDKGIINWATVLDDTPVIFKEVNGDFIEYPRNSPHKYDGLINIKKAITFSKNTIAVRLYNMIGSEEVFLNLKNKYKFDTLVSGIYDAKGAYHTDKDIAPLALGQLTKGVSLRALTSAYTVFPGEGELYKNRSYIKVLDRNNNILLENKVEKQEILKKSTAEIMNQLLSCVVNEGTAKSISLKEIVDTAGKTGTSALNRDKLFVGYTPYVTFGVWCGYDDGTRTLDGVDVKHLDIWDSISTEIHSVILSDIKDSHIKHFKKDMLVYLPYCMDSGKIYSGNCEYDERGARLEYGHFSMNNFPKEECDRHMLLNVYDDAYDEWSERSFLKLEERNFPKYVYIEDEKYRYPE